VKNRREGERDTALLIHLPVTDIHRATEMETPASFLTLPRMDFSERYRNVLESLSPFYASPDEYVWQVSISTARAFCSGIKYVNARRVRGKT
jgi:hypothetical protein